MKISDGSISATPSKRLFLSIIADYDLNRSICELIDNALDVWTRKGRKGNVSVAVELDPMQQTICVEDCAGGLRREDLRYVVGPGQTGTSINDETIGIFGVGTKRAVVALAQDIKITTRFEKENTYQIDFDEKWLEDDEWELEVYKVDEIKPGTTIVELQRLRFHIDDVLIAHLREHLSATYALFLKSVAVSIILNRKPITPTFFENWAYPPSYPPTRYRGELKTEDGRMVRVEAIGGLARESSPAAGEYGVYIYCNDRLVARALKTFEVGFQRGQAGLPHPKVSLTRVLVFLSGEARSMPWNSSKSDISTKHEVFVALHDWLAQTVKDYASLSRIWMGDWPEKVFRFATGEMREVRVDNFPLARKSFLPPPPKSRPRYGEIITQKNRIVAHRKPWTRGLYEGVIAADVIFKQNLEQKNRIALIVIDSTLEIAFKEYLVNESGAAYSDARLLQIFADRNQVHNEIKKYVNFGADQWKKIEYYYRLRCKLVHEKATAGIKDDQIIDFRSVVEKALRKMFKLTFDTK